MMNRILTQCGSVFLAGVIVACLAAPVANADGVPEPGITLQGKVKAADGSQLMNGRLTWTLTPVSGTGSPVVAMTDLLPLVSDSGATFSYRIHIPSETPSGGLPISSNCLPVTASPVVYRRQATLDGAFTTLVTGPTTTTFSLAERGKTERVDLVLGISGPPGVPSNPFPANGQVLVPLDVTPDWADAALAQTYDVYLWQTGYAKPPAPTLAGLTKSQFQPPTLLRPDMPYSWQVIARNSKGSTAGPTWTFRTAFQGDLQTLLEYLLGKRYLTFQEQSLLDLNVDASVDVADFVKGLKRSVLSGRAASQQIAPAQTEMANGASQSPALLAPVTISIGSATITTSKTTTVVLPVNVSPAITGVAGLNLKIEADPTLIQLTGIRVKQVNAGEFLYFYCPYSGVMNVVFFANPVASLKSSGATVLQLDLKATLPVANSSTAIRLTAAAVSDVNGASNPSLTQANGSVIYTPPSPPKTSGRHWEIYR